MNQIQAEADVVLQKEQRVEINENTPFVLICVYGTLRRGEGNYRYHLEGTTSEYLGTFNSEPIFTMYGRRAGFPVLSDEGTTSIVYEVFKITDQKVLNGLHNLEGCTGIPGHPNNWYDIMPMKVPTGPGGALEDAWIYVQRGFTSSVHGPIPSGDWKQKSV